MSVFKYLNPYNWLNIMDECKNKHVTKEEKDIFNEDNGVLSLEQKKKILETKKKELKGFDEQMDDFSKDLDSAMDFDLDLGIFGEEKDKNKKNNKDKPKIQISNDLNLNMDLDLDIDNNKNKENKNNDDYLDNQKEINEQIRREKEKIRIMKEKLLKEREAQQKKYEEDLRAKKLRYENELEKMKLEQENKIKNELLEINNFERKDKCPEEIRNELKEEIFEKLSKAKNGNKIKALLDMLFLNFYSFMNGERFIRSKIRKYIIDYFKPFLKYISKQIAIYSKKTVDNQEKIKSYFTNIYNLIQERLEILKSEYKIKITKYGSYASKLFIEGSDMDLLIYYKENKESKVSTFGEKLYKLFKNYKNIFLINKIDEKNLITLNFFFQDIIFQDPYNYINNKKNYPPINQTISVDITYTSKRDEYYKKKKIVEKILDKLLENPHIFFCYFVLKRILVINNLNKIYYGGLSSYGIQSLVFHIEDRTLKISPNKTKSGEFLFIFFVRYSKFDFYKYVVEKDGNKRRKKSEHPKTLKNPEYYENMITIDDPMDEDNLIKGGYTPTKFFIDKPKNYICEKIRTLFQKEFEVLKNCYLEFSKKTKKEKTTEKMDFILELFNVKIDNK